MIEQHRRRICFAAYALLFLSPIVFLVTQLYAQVASPGPAMAMAEARSNVQEAIERFRKRPHIATQYDYIMTARVRLLLFWVGKDDVGGGYIRRGVLPDNPSSNAIELLMGSDPKKAPRAINRWGAASELFERAGPDIRTSTFFGFMKTYKGSNPAEMEKELASEKGGQDFLFSAIIDENSPAKELVKVLPFASDTDFTMGDLDHVVPGVLERLAGPKGIEKNPDASRRSHGCAGGFLSSVAGLAEAAISAPKERASACYVYNTEEHRVTLVRASPVSHEDVELTLIGQTQKYTRTYHDLVLAQIENESATTKKRSSFQLLLGTKGDLRGVPVRITYQPNWWFQVILNLKTPS
jgi:hypothetical protein